MVLYLNAGINVRQIAAAVQVILAGYLYGATGPRVVSKAASASLSELDAYRTFILNFKHMQVQEYIRALLLPLPA